MAQVNDLLIMGKTRALNPINGSCTNGTTVTTQTQSTKFMREDGTWSAPSYTAATTDKYHTTGTWSGLTYTATANGGAGALAFTIPTGTTASTVCVGNDSRLSNARTPTSHTHGNIQNGGTLQTNDITIASGDKLVVTDSSDSSKIARTSISFDGSTATQCLTKKGTWATFGTSNLTIGTTASTAMAGNTAVNNVTQTATDTSQSTYEILFSSSADNTTRTEGTRKSQHFTYYPSMKTLRVGYQNGGAVYSTEFFASTGDNYFVAINAGDEKSYESKVTVKQSNKYIDYNSDDIKKYGTNNTWDGTNTSLVTAVTDKVSKSSGTTVDNPILGAIAITDNFFSKVASVDLSKSNNNLSSDYFGLVDFRDKNKKRFGYIQYGVRTSGGTDASLRAVNFPAGGTTEYTNSLTLMTSKAGAYTYSVTNAANFRSAIGAAASSSIKTKENIKDLTENEALKLLEIRPVSFDYKQGFDIDNKYERNYGVIAEETLDIIPSVVNVPTTEGYEFDETKGTNQELITVDYAKFIPYLIKLVQMQQQEIDELKNK